MGQIIFNILIGVIGLGAILFFISQNRSKNKKQVSKLLQEKDSVLQNMKFTKMLELQSKSIQLETNELKAQNMMLTEETINEIEQMMKSHYLKLLKEKTLLFKNRIQNYIDALEANKQDIEITDYLENTEVKYIAVTVRREKLDKSEEYNNCKDNTIREVIIRKSLIDILKHIQESLDNFINLPDYLIYVKQIVYIFDILKKEMSVRVVRNGFDEKSPEEWIEYVNRAVSSFESTFTTNLDQLYWHKSIIDRISVYDHNVKLLPEIRIMIKDLFDDLRRKTIEIKKKAKTLRDEIDITYKS